jgi:hypothetical protein
VRWQLASDAELTATTPVVQPGGLNVIRDVLGVRVRAPNTCGA